MKKQVVTGAYGYSGRYITMRLLEQGHTVHTITNSPERPNPFGRRVTATPFHFDEPGKLIASLEGADVLYNTYWVRFNHKDFTHGGAVENTLKLFSAARQAGIRRVVHVSITNPSEDSDLEYFSGKARLEDALKQTGLSYSILRPTLLFGKGDILVNNIAWALRRFPVFGLFGDGGYRLQPICVDDLAKLAVHQGQLRQNTVIDAVGPETFSFRELVETIGKNIGKRRRIISVSPQIGYIAAALIGRVVGDVFLTREEITGLTRGLLCTSSGPAGETRLTDWSREHADSLGRTYASELARRRRSRAGARARHAAK